MGYTHQWLRTAEVHPDDWETIRADVQTIIDASGIVVVGVDGTSRSLPGAVGSSIRFDPEPGIGGETFFLARAASEHEFCKTSRYAYDVIVAGVLCYLESIAEILEVRCYDRGDYSEGLELARKALPQHADRLRLPDHEYS